MSDSILLAMQRALTAVSQGLRVGMPASVVSYDATKRMASVVVVTPEVLEDGTVLPQPVIRSVPVMFSGGAGGSLTFPLQAGDQGWVLFADRDISGWVTGVPAQEQGQRQHAMTDAVFFPCFPNPLATPASATDAVLSFGGSTVALAPNGNVTITPASGTLTVVGNAVVTGTVATTSLTANEATLDGIAFTTHTHAHGGEAGITDPPQNPE